MKVHQVDPSVDSSVLLAGAQFIDAYSVAIDDAALDARRAAEKMLARVPRWIEALLALRNYLRQRHHARPPDHHEVMAQPRDKRADYKRHWAWLLPAAHRRLETRNQPAYPVR